MAKDAHFCCEKLFEVNLNFFFFSRKKFGHYDKSYAANLHFFPLQIYICMSEICEFDIPDSKYVIEIALSRTVLREIILK